VLHLAGGTPLGVDVRDLLQLQGAFEGQGEVKAAPEVEETAAIREALSDFANRVALLESDRQEIGQLREALEHLTYQRRIGEAWREAELGREQHDRRELRREGLGRSDADLDARPGVDHTVGLTCQ